MPFTADTIYEFRKSIAKIPQKQEQLKELTNYEAKKAIPVILQILREINVKLSQLYPMPSEIDDTLKFTNYGIKILEETDEKQNVGFFGIKKVLKGLSKAKIESELAFLVTEAKHIAVTQNTLQLWEEVSLWLDGLYNRIYDKLPKDTYGQVKRNKFGLFDTVDTEDALFNTFVHLTKFDVVIYYHRLAEIINEKTKIFQSKQITGLDPNLNNPDVNNNNNKMEVIEAPKPSSTTYFRY